MFYAEAVSKLFMLVLVSYASTILYGVEPIEDNGNVVKTMIFLMLAGIGLHELGELEESEFAIREHFGVRTYVYRMCASLFINHGCWYVCSNEIFADSTVRRRS